MLFPAKQVACARKADCFDSKSDVLFVLDRGGLFRAETLQEEPAALVRNSPACAWIGGTGGCLGYRKALPMQKNQWRSPREAALESRS